MTYVSNRRTVSGAGSMTSFWGSSDICEPLVLHSDEAFQIPGAWKEKYDVVYAFDVECQRMDGGEGVKSIRNKILSYQIAVLDLKAKTPLYTERIIYTDHGKRITLAELLHEVVYECLGYGRSKADGLRVLQLAHFGTMEWASFRDRDKLKFFSLIHKVPVCSNHKIDVLMDSRHKAKISFSAMDTSLHAPAGCGALKELAKMTSVRKLDIGGNIENMEQFLHDEPEMFCHYAINDVRATMAYEAVFLNAVREIVGYPCIPHTLGDLSIKTMDKVLRDIQGLHHDNGNLRSNPALLSLLGKKVAQAKDDKGHQLKKLMKTYEHMINQSMCASAFHGGLNSSYIWGEVLCRDDQIILDLDLRSAYPTAHSAFADIDFSKGPIVGSPRASVRSIEELNKLIGMDISSDTPVHGFFHVDFKWDDDTRFPCIPCKDAAAGLLYVLEGMTVCTAPEIAAALETGKCSVTVKQYLIFPNIAEKFTLAAIFRRFLEERGKYPKGALMELLWKECSNSLYGKLAQGVKERKVKNMDGKGERQLGESGITCVYYAAECTGLVRAALSSMVSIIGSEPGHRVLSVTTDGMMVLVPKPENFELPVDDRGIAVIKGLSVERVLSAKLVQKLQSSAAIRQFIVGRNRVAPGDTWLEVKHAGDRAGIYRTRCSWLTYKGVQQYTAASGMQVRDFNLMIQIAKNENLTAIPVSRLTGVSDICRGRASDIVRVAGTQRASLAPDSKRLLSADGMESYPYKTVSDVARDREIVRSCRQQGLALAPDTLMLRKSCKQNKTKVGRADTIKRKCRNFVIRALAHDTPAWGQPGMKKKDIALMLGLKDLKNYARQDMIFNSVPNVPEAIEAMEEICRRLNISLTDEMKAEILAA